MRTQQDKDNLLQRIELARAKESKPEGITAEAYLESIGHEFDKDRSGLYLEEYEFREYRLKDMLKVMEDYAKAYAASITNPDNLI